MATNYWRGGLDLVCPSSELIEMNQRGDLSSEATMAESETGIPIKDDPVDDNKENEPSVSNRSVGWADIVKKGPADPRDVSQRRICGAEMLCGDGCRDASSAGREASGLALA